MFIGDDMWGTAIDMSPAVCGIKPGGEVNSIIALYSNGAWYVLALVLSLYCDCQISESSVQEQPRIITILQGTNEKKTTG